MEADMSEVGAERALQVTPSSNIDNRVLRDPASRLSPSLRFPSHFRRQQSQDAWCTKRM